MSSFIYGEVIMVYYIGASLIFFSAAGACYIAARKYQSTGVGIVIVCVLCTVAGLVCLAVPLFSV